MKKFIFVFLLLMAAVGRGEVPRISLLTALPGEEIYELEGHTGLRVRSADADYVVNWGIFDFNSPGFVYRFCKGETDYLCAAYPSEFFFDDYARQGRQVIEQQVMLDSIQTMRLIGLLESNLRPENRVYRYNYVKDNCATRPLMLIEQALGEPLIASGGEETTFRREMTEYHRDFPWYQFGIDLALGCGIDKPIGRREAIFAPVRLARELEGNPHIGPIVTHGEQKIVHSRTPFLLTPVALGWLMLILALALRGKAGKVFDSVMFGLFGLTGCILFFLVFFSSHEATSPNLLLLWLNPLCFLGAIIPWLKSAKKLKVWYFFINFALLIVFALLLFPMGRHLNAAMLPLLMADAIRSAANLKSIYGDKIHKWPKISRR
ncbi:MAG: DUF4105 domain-containing protein [Bacteroides sp.]|nr:DUF4105 domain-containing protein [Bacteroides sp.]